MPSSTPNDQSIWDILDNLESKLIDSFHSTSEIVLPQLIETSNELYAQLEAVSRQVYEKSLELGQKSEILSAILPNAHEPPLSISQAILLPPSNPAPPSLLRRILKPRTVLITAAVWLSSTLALRLLRSSDAFHTFLQAHPDLRSALPASLRPQRKKNATLIRPRYSTGGKTRLEAIVVLCADPGTIGSQIALELASAGYIVIASVSNLAAISTLERDGLGWVKALVLDPSRPELAPAFNRALLSSVSLRYPLHSAGDAFQGDGLHSSLVGMVNCFPIGTIDELRPVETLQSETELMPCLARTVGISLEVVKFVLPMMRNSIEKAGGVDGVILTLFPTKTSSLALPYLSASVIANQSLETLMTTLRRELLISDSASKSQIRILNERIGLFKLPAHFPRIPTPLPSLPAHLHPIYAPSLSRRLGFLALPSTNLPVHSINGSPLAHLIQRVKRLLQSPCIPAGSATAVGRQVWTYRLIGSFAPSGAVEMWLSLVERMNGWVRRRVSGEVDLESAETLEQVIEKRNFSMQSGWKAKAFEGSREADVDVQEAESERLDAVVAGQDSVLEPEPSGPVEDVPTEGETESLVDKGEAAEQMQDSFVGSEIDWKAQEDDETPPAGPEVTEEPVAATEEATEEPVAAIEEEKTESPPEAEE
ncbi:hypothetical protein CROQUDRAFT_657269 [Cronartium quercuum f. sp. fusiforme G11]|uniref:DUF1776-domain-containing protein n=1 Tax=Cronartium quercuum f. sp. fusiforme G11 TaxID=708437 RepID=A0A9P6TBN9_9BASI|nr:hypothetical protein CROQUDRAFT_657269 [Cronartium quercuum f. sp. fusiforme G11]